MHPLVEKILDNRRIADRGVFLNPSYHERPNPFLMKDMEKAVERMLQAISNNEKIGRALQETSIRAEDPLWQMPLWAPYAKGLSSPVADLCNITSDGMAGSVTAALFLQRFVSEAKAWAHLDIFAWSPVAKPHAPVGGEAQGIRALLVALKARYGAA